MICLAILAHRTACVAKRTLSVYPMAYANRQNGGLVTRHSSSEEHVRIQLGHPSSVEDSVSQVSSGPRSASIDDYFN
jgi:hypothetical protein